MEMMEFRLSERPSLARLPLMRPTSTARWQRALRVGDRVVAAVRGGGSLTFVWGTIVEAAEGSTHVRVLRHSADRPGGVEERMPRAAAVFPVSGERFEAARREGWPAERRAVHALVGMVAGGLA
jgi:hypothetical protein